MSEYEKILSECQQYNERLDVAVLILILLELRKQNETPEPRKDKKQGSLRGRTGERVQRSGSFGGVSIRPETNSSQNWSEQTPTS